MSQTVSLVLSSQTSQAREEIVEDRRHAVKHVLQACIVLLSDERLPVLEVARQAKVSRPMMWRWQQRLAEEGWTACFTTRRARSASQRPRWPRCRPCWSARSRASRRALRRTGRSAMSTACGLSLRTVQRIWDAHRLQPHRVRTFKRSTDPQFVAKLDDVVGLFMAPPRHAVVLSIDDPSTGSG